MLLPTDLTSTSKPVLTSWKEIACYMGKGVRTVQRWEQDFGLPVRRPAHSDKKAVLARPTDLDAWIAMRCPSRGEQEKCQEFPANTLLMRARLATTLETARILRQAQRTVCTDLCFALGALRDSLEKMRKERCLEP
jgi:hypothetical protein